MNGKAIIALTYSDSTAADQAMRELAKALREEGWRLAGLVQINSPRPGRPRCDMELEDLGIGARIAIGTDRGRLARGCKLDVDQLLVAMEGVRAQLTPQTDLLILNKFGKVESEGGGLRAVVADAIEAGVPILIAVPWRNIDNWRLFAGELSLELPIDEAGKSDLRTLRSLLSEMRSEGPEFARPPTVTVPSDHEPSGSADKV